MHETIARERNPFMYNTSSLYVVLHKVNVSYRAVASALRADYICMYHDDREPFDLVASSVVGSSVC
jgi:hypothetical protein